MRTVGAHLPVQITPRMNYIRIFDIEQYEAETKLNAWLKEIEEVGHRVLSTRAHFYTFTNERKGESYDYVKVLFVVNDAPHPHKNK
jgi:hypothetical protein